MIPRYRRPEMAAIWEDDNRYRIWLEVETLALEQMAAEGLAPKEAVEAVRSKGAFDKARIDELEKELKHDVIAFLTNVAEHVGPLSRYVHRGMTSSDLLDTSFAVQLKQSGELMLEGLDRLISAIGARAKQYKYTPCIGRSHGIHAEPTSFGLKLLTWYAEFKRQRERLQQALNDVAVGMISGAVGTYASVPPAVEAYVMKKLGLGCEDVSTQVVPRDRHAAFFNALALLGASIERCAIEVRHLQRTEVREAEEYFSKGQKGSSAMPHKRNPILTENLTGLARLLRGYAQTALENVALWHERDISHSSVERVVAPDACCVADFMLHRFRGVVEGLVVHEARMRENLEYSRGLVFSGTLLLALADRDMSRETAYSIVQQHALAAWDGGKTFKERVREDERVTSLLSAEQIEEVFDLTRHLRHVDSIFERVMGEK